MSVAHSVFAGGVQFAGRQSAAGAVSFREEELADRGEGDSCDKQGEPRLLVGGVLLK